jgi:hypothetical protein
MGTSATMVTPARKSCIIISPAMRFKKKRMRKKTVISRARRTQPITLVLGDSRATAACAKLPRGKKWTKLSGTSFKR